VRKHQVSGNIRQIHRFVSTYLKEHREEHTGTQTGMSVLLIFPMNRVVLNKNRGSILRR